MKGITKEEQYILYALGKSYQSFNRKFFDKPLEVSISKVVFIDILISSKSVKKKERAIYKNIESLEKKRYLKYKNKELTFTKKGLTTFKKVDNEIISYLDLNMHLQDPKTLHLHKKLQTKLKR